MQSPDICEEFQSQLNKYTRKTWDGQLFVLVDSLQEWLRIPQGGGSAPLSRLLKSAYEGFWNWPGDPAILSLFEPGPECCLLLFCILQSLGRGHLIDKFSMENKDASIPLPRSCIQRVLEIAHIEDAEFANKFDELQYRFQPVRFILHRRRYWDGRFIVPIYQRKHIKTGGTASLWQIMVPEEFVGKKLRAMCSGSRFNAATNGEPDWVCIQTSQNFSNPQDSHFVSYNALNFGLLMFMKQYQFALKSFPYENRDLFANEVDALSGLQYHEGIVRWLGAYTKVDIHTESRPATHDVSSSAKPNETHNILLEYGEMDLGVYFGLNLPPFLLNEILDLWKSLKGVAEAVMAVHNPKVSSYGETTEYYGWHADIKPENILQVEDRLRANTGNPNQDQAKQEKAEIAFKLADPGFAVFIKKSQGLPPGDPRITLCGGTATYGAPEYPGCSDRPVTQAIDIWSLGCVFSLVATWIVYGFEHISIFQQVRQKAIKNQRTLDQTHMQGHRMAEGDQFHNGYEVLQTVTEWHSYLRKGMRSEDSITPQILELIDNRMLVVPPERRIKAQELCSELDRILKTSTTQVGVQLSEEFLTLLGEFDREEAVCAGEIRQSQNLTQASSSSGKTTTGGRRPLRAEWPLVTTHRSSIWPNQSSRSQAGAGHEGRKTHMQPLSAQRLALASNTEPLNTPSRHERTSSGSGGEGLATHLHRFSSPKKKHDSQNYFQALEKVESQESSNWLKIPSRKGNPSDPHLAQYFTDRDIIFLVDNGSSMDKHWRQATDLLDLLVRKARGLDENGMDLRFTVGRHRLENTESASKFKDTMKAARPRTHTSQQAHTDLRVSLGRIFKDYIKNMEKNKEKDATVYILTDGLWAGMDDKNQVAQHIKTFSTEMKASRSRLKHRPFSIQFIQFGYDVDASQRLKHLDEALCEEGIDDFIDTEHANEDINKMLLGSFVEDYDHDEGEGLSSYSSVSSVQHASETTKSTESTSDEAVFESSPVQGHSQGVTTAHIGAMFPNSMWMP